MGGNLVKFTVKSKQFVRFIWFASNFNLNKRILIKTSFVGVFFSRNIFDQGVQITPDPLSNTSYSWIKCENANPSIIKLLELWKNEGGFLPKNQKRKSADVLAVRNGCHHLRSVALTFIN